MTLRILLVFLLLAMVGAPLRASAQTADTGAPAEPPLPPEILKMLRESAAEPEDPQVVTKRWMELLGSMLTGMVTKHQVDDPLVPTGDALFDEWAKAVQAQIDGGVYGKTGEPAGVLSAAWFDGLEKRFGSDPRYWELRYLNARAMRDTADDVDATAPSSGRFADPADILREADKRGVAKANTLLLLWLEASSERGESRSEAWSRQLDEQGLRKFERTRDEMAQLEALRLEHERTPAANIPESELDILRRAIQLAPDEAWPYYALGLDLIDMGRDEEGIAQIKAGNGLAWRTPYPYPLPQLMWAAYATEPLGSQRISGASALLWISARPPNRLPQVKRAMASYLARHPGPVSDDAAALHTFITRVGLESLEAIAVLSAWVNTTMLAEAALETWDLTTEQRDGLLRIRGAIEAAKESYHAAQEPWLYPEERVINKSLAYGESGVYLVAWDMLRGDQDVVRAVAPHLSALSQFDYTTLELPEALAQYPPVRRIDKRMEAQARRVGRELSAYLENTHQAGSVFAE
ncbi:MAG: hypothetical protein M3R04_03140 [bacterium]|nr:hypothetical protein [bacterium]